LKIAVLDLESTGLKPDRDLIVEIGIIELNLTNGKTKILLDEVVLEPSFCSEIYGNSWIFQNSSLQVNDVLNGKDWNILKPIIQEILEKYPITGYNKNFGFSFLRHRKLKILRELQCPMICATNILKLPHNHYGYKYPKLEEAWAYYFPDIIYVESHRACNDAYHEALLIKKMYDENHWDPTI